jgi:hypothetical protein
MISRWIKSMPLAAKALSLSSRLKKFVDRMEGKTGFIG